MALAKSRSKASGVRRPVRAVDQALGVYRFKGPAQMCFEGVLADQRQRGRHHVRGVARNHLEVRQIVCRQEIGARHHDGEMAETGILRQHREEGVDHARAETFGDDDAIDVSTLRCFAAASIESAPTTPVHSPSETDSAG